MIDHKTKITVARSKLREEYPLFGVLAAEMNIAPDLSGRVATACISRRGNMLYNPAFIDSLTFRQTMGALAHEALHPALEFWDRLDGRIFDRANLAHDHVINLMIHAAGLDLPDEVAMDSQYHNMAFEEVYERLPNQIQGFTLLGDVHSSLTELADQWFEVDAPVNPLEADKAAKERWRNALIRGVKADRDENGGRGIGRLPADIRTLIHDIMYPPIAFEHRLQHYLGQWGRKSQSTFRRFNKFNTFEPLSRLYPGHRRSGGRLYVLIDTSGSMFSSCNTELIRYAFGSVQSISESVGMDVVIVTCDAQLKQRLTLQEVLDAIFEGSVAVTGGGGSDFRDAFELIWKEIGQSPYGSPVLCFTDGDIVVPSHAPPLRSETFWITLPQHHTPTSVWGEHLPLVVPMASDARQTTRP